MLPSTGNFKGINCPFFDSGLCERPYCHFRHVKKDAASLEPSGDMLEQLVSEAVKKVLLQKEMLPGASTDTPARDLVSQVVEELELKTNPSEMLLEETKQQLLTIPSYNPTPIVELNKKRHIPVPYTPSISSKVQLKRHTSPENTSKYFKPSKRTKLPREPTTTVMPLPLPSLEYNPDMDTSKCVGYSPSCASSQENAMHSYTPSAIATLVPPVTDYVPIGTGNAKAIYEPSGLKSKEPEYMPLSENVSTSIDSYIPTDKSKLLEINFDDMLPEFEMLDEILQEHAQMSSEEDTVTNDGPETDTEANDGATDVSGYSQTGNQIQNGTGNVLGTNGAIKSEFQVVNGDNRLKSHESDTCNRISGKSAFDLLVETDTKWTPSNFDGQESKETPGSDIKSQPRSSKPGEKSKSSRRSSSSHKNVSKSKSCSKTETKDTKHSNKHKSKHKDKHKDEHSNKLSKTKSSSSHSTSKGSKDSKKHSSSRSKTSSSSKSSSRHKSSSADHKHKSSAKSEKRESSSTSKVHVELSDSKHQSLDDLETISLMSDIDHADALSMDSDLDDEEIEQQCLRIFQEYKPLPKTENKKPPSFHEVVDITDELPSKKRTAHEGALRMSHLAPPIKRPSITPQQVFAQRYKAAKLLHQKHKEEEAILKNDRLQQTISTDSHKMAMRLQKMRELAERTSDAKPLNSGKIRIAHVPNVDGLLKAKSKVESFTVRRQQLEELQKRKADAIKRHEDHVSTVSQTVIKGSKRVAHLPAARLLEEPIIIPERGMKIPAAVRQKSLNLLVKEHLIYFDKEEAYLQAEEVEGQIYKKSINSISYTSSISSAVLRLRKALGMDTKPKLSYSEVVARGSRTVSHSDMLASRIKGSWSIEQPTKVADTKVETLYAKLSKYILTEEQLVSNGFPRKHPTIIGAAVARTKYHQNKEVEPFERDCIRCQAKYEVDKHGIQVHADLCIYHDSKPFRQFNRGRYDNLCRYLCCNASLENARGCQESEYHICTNFQLTNHGFQPTPEPTTEPSNGDYGVYALDCEMVYTTLGLEVARVTIVDEKSQNIFDRFVRPEGMILDYATKFSGITAADMEGVTTTLHELQAAIFAIINSKSIVIGHSLDSDLRVLKIFHDTVVDTSVVFPHNDTTKKKALKTLTCAFLERAIQQSDEGHDSTEDARAAMDLMIFKIRSDYH